MSAVPKVSLVIVSRGRPNQLARLLRSLRFLDYPALEVIVVSDSAPDQEGVRFVPFAEANISAARNRGLSACAGDIVAFCDDDAVPEPSWLTHLIAPFRDPSVGASGGYVLGRNGISFQWKGRSFDCFGRHEDLDLPSNEPRIMAGDKTRGIKTEGTNAAFSLAALREIGGFDESFCYYLDETDVNYRLGVAGWKTAIVPLARVHHGYAANAFRRQNRAPKTLFEIGASKACFCVKHAPKPKVKEVLEQFRQLQRKRLIRFMLRGEIEPRDVGHLIATLDAGMADGAGRGRREGVLPPARAAAFLPFPRATGGQIGVACRPLRWRRVRPKVLALSRRGACVTVLRLSRSGLFHRMRFHDDGYWVQTGGIFGRANRDDRAVRWFTFKARCQVERTRLSDVRPFQICPIDRLEKFT